MSIRILSKIALAMLLAGSARADDAMDPYRERFKIGYEKYLSGAVGEALQYWEPIYRELGPARGYRLSYNIARAYETLGDATRAAERYESFLSEAKVRKDAGEPIEEIVERETGEAQTHLDGLIQSYGRIHVLPTTPAETVRIDSVEPRLAGFVAFVPPGHHTVTFAPGTKEEEKRDLELAAGQMLDVVPTPKPEKPVPPPPPQIREVRETKHPFGIGWVFVAGGASLASIVAPVVAYSVAQSKYNAYKLETQDVVEQTRLANDYLSARTAAYVMLAIPLVLGAATGGLVLGYAFGTKQSVRFVPVGAGATVIGTF
jgi:hypothetical protein